MLPGMAGSSGYPKISGRVVRVSGISGFQKCYPKLAWKKKNPKIRVPENSGTRKFGFGFTRTTRINDTAVAMAACGAHLCGDRRAPRRWARRRRRPADPGAWARRRPANPWSVGAAATAVAGGPLERGRGGRRTPERWAWRRRPAGTWTHSIRTVPCCPRAGRSGILFSRGHPLVCRRCSSGNAHSPSARTASSLGSPSSFRRPRMWPSRALSSRGNAARIERAGVWGASWLVRGWGAGAARGLGTGV